MNFDLLPVPLFERNLDRYKKFITWCIENPSSEQVKERHHIVPICFFKNNRSFRNTNFNKTTGFIDGDPDEDSNIALLDVRQHFIAHHLLWLAYRNLQMARSLHIFSLRINEKVARVLERIKPALTADATGRMNFYYYKNDDVKTKQWWERVTKKDPDKEAKFQQYWLDVERARLRKIDTRRKSSSAREVKVREVKVREVKVREVKVREVKIREVKVKSRIKGQKTIDLNHINIFANLSTLEAAIKTYDWEQPVHIIQRDALRIACAVQYFTNQPFGG